MTAATPTGAGRAGELSRQERVTLLELARASLNAAVRRQPAPGKPPKVTPLLEELRGAFVTLTVGGELRGCIGYIKAVKPLWQAVSAMAVQAGLHDPRFYPVTEEELGGLQVEISVLSPLARVDNTATIEVGRHGLMIVKGFASGLLLPQVASEYGWDRETFLSHTCQKAGLPSDAWKQGAEIYSFSAEVFSERSVGLEAAAT